jgi:dTDP-4-amino-4,6-dideoxygalactose transaminase
MIHKNPIPFLDLVSAHQEIEEELSGVFRTVVKTAGFIGGPLVQDFEEAFAAYCDSSYCVGVASGTDALRFALIAAGVRQGDLVVTVPHTFIATTEAISQAGGQPAFVDIDERTYNIDVQKLAEYLDVECRFDPGTRRLFDRKTERRVTAIVPVHLYGQMADMDPILEIAEKYHLVVVEDACQAHGAQYFSRRENRWKKAGSMGRAAAFSFYPGKNLGACGEAGAVTTDDAELAGKMRMLRDHGQATKYYHDIEGYNGRLDAIQAGILLAKMRYLPSWIEKRMRAAELYRVLFADAGLDISLPYEASGTRSSYHLFVVRVDEREALIRHLTDAGIGTGIHYPVPLHLQKAYKGLGYRLGDFPIVERLSKEILSLPMFPGITEEQQARVVDEVAGFVCDAQETLVFEQ